MDDDKITAVTTIGFLAAMIGYIISAIAVFGSYRGGDVNLDGVFTISDVPEGLWYSALYPGAWLLGFLTPQMQGFIEYVPGILSGHVILAAIAFWIGLIVGVAYALWLAGDFYESMKDLIIGRPKK